MKNDKDSKKKLVIKKEKVRELTNADLAGVAGAMLANTMNNGCTYNSTRVKCAML